MNEYTDEDELGSEGSRVGGAEKALSCIGLSFEVCLCSRWLRELPVGKRKKEKSCLKTPMRMQSQTLQSREPG